MRPPAGVLLDLDGTLYEDADLIPGAARSLARIRAAGIPVRFVTNTTRMARRLLRDRLRGFGIAAELDDVLSAPATAALAHHRDEAFFREGLCQLRKDAATGIDEMTVAYYGQNLKENLADLHRRMVNRKYRAQPARRVWIPKSDGSQRPLAILRLIGMWLHVGVMEEGKVRGVITKHDLLSLVIGR